MAHFFLVAPAVSHVNTVSDESCKEIFPLMALSERKNTIVLLIFIDRLFDVCYWEKRMVEWISASLWMHSVLGRTDHLQRCIF